MSENIKHVPSVEFLGSLDVVKTELIGARRIFYLDDPDYRISIGDTEDERVVHYKDDCFSMDDYDEEDRKQFINILWCLCMSSVLTKMQSWRK